MRGDRYDLGQVAPCCLSEELSSENCEQLLGLLQVKLLLLFGRPLWNYRDGGGGSFSQQDSGQGGTRAINNSNR